MYASQPIGIFDSGIGGLTVARAVKERLPNEQIIYFGDTAHLPYGDKSASTIQAYSVKIVDILMKMNCKVILIACNSASSAAYELLQEYCGSKAHVIDVINPMIRAISTQYQGQHIGLIGTKQTVDAGVYERKLRENIDRITFSALATPMLVPMIEEGFFENNISHDIIYKYLSDKQLEGVEQLILGCTHYPVIGNEIQQVLHEMGRDVQVVDSAIVTAEALESYLADQALAHQGKELEDRFLVSDYTRSFEQSARLFFGEQVRLERFEIWD